MPTSVNPMVEIIFRIIFGIIAFVLTAAPLLILVERRYLESRKSGVPMKLFAISRQQLARGLGLSAFYYLLIYPFVMTFFLPVILPPLVPYKGEYLPWEVEGRGLLPFFLGFILMLICILGCICTVVIGKFMTLKRQKVQNETTERL